MTATATGLESALGWLASHRGLVRFLDEPDDEPAVWAMARVEGDPDARIISTVVLAGREPLVVAVEAIREVQDELAAVQSRRTLRLVPGESD